MKKIIILTGLFVTIVGAGLFASRSVLAQTAGNGQDRISSLVQKIADKFGLNKDEVQAVFDQEREERQTEMEANREKHQAEMQAKHEEQLNQAVTDGKITEEQKNLILAKLQEIEANRQTKREAMKDMTSDQRKAAMEEERQKIETWAKENGIDLNLLGFGLGDGRGPGFGGGPGGPKGETSVTENQ